VFVVWQDNNGDRASQDFCRQIRTQYGLTMPVVVYTTDSAAASAGLAARHVDIVSERGARVVFRSEGDDRSFITAIDDALR